MRAFEARYAHGALSELTLHRGTAGAGPQAMRAGHDLVLEPTWADGAVLAAGTALDDHLVAHDRPAVDAAARAALAAWRATHTAALTVDGLDLTHVCEVELLATCFVPAQRIERALPRALGALGATSIRLEGLDPATSDSSEPSRARRTSSARRRSQRRRRRHPHEARSPRRDCRPCVAAGCRRARGGGSSASRTGTSTRSTHGSPRQAARWRRCPPRVALASLGPRRALAVAVRGGWIGAAWARALERAARILDERIAALDADDARASCRAERHRTQRRECDRSP